MTMLVPSFNLIGKNGMKGIIFAYYHITKVKENFFLFLRAAAFKRISLIKRIYYQD